MSLREAILDIAEAMEKGADVKLDEGCFVALEFYAKQLRIACKAAGDAPTNRDITSMLISPEAQHAREIARAREEFSHKKDRAVHEEQHSDDVVMVIGGPAAPEGESTVVSNDPTMPVGAFRIISGAVYKLNQDGSGVRTLVYDAEQTKKSIAVK